MGSGCSKKKSATPNPSVPMKTEQLIAEGLCVYLITDAASYQLFHHALAHRLKRRFGASRLDDGHRLWEIEGAPTTVLRPVNYRMYLSDEKVPLSLRPDPLLYNEVVLFLASNRSSQKHLELAQTRLCYPSDKTRTFGMYIDLPQTRVTTSKVFACNSNGDKDAAICSALSQFESHLQYWASERDYEHSRKVAAEMSAVAAAHSSSSSPLPVSPPPLAPESKKRQ